MSIRNLQAVLKPRSVALIGASDRPRSIGSVVTANLLAGGFHGPIDLINPRHRSIGGVRVYPDVASLPEAPDLAVIATPPATVPGLIAELAGAGTRAAVVITAGLGEHSDGRDLRQAMLDAARPALLRIVGPNCVGVMVPGIGLNASFAHSAPKAGSIAFVAQSGAIVTSVIDWAVDRNIGFSHLVSLGNMADVDFGDLLDYLANDADTRAILLYIEAITQARKFMSAARAAARTKPVVVVKAGRHLEGARAAASHTGAMTGSDAVYDAAFRRAGMLRVITLEELFDALESLTIGRHPGGSRLAIVSNGGGIGVLATDALIDHGGTLATLDDATVAALDAVLPPTWSHGNPVDMVGDADENRYLKTLEVLGQAGGIDATLVLNCPTAVTSSLETARAVAEFGARNGDRCLLLTSWVGGGTALQARNLFARHGIPTFSTPEQAVRAFMHLVTYRRNQELLTETPPASPQRFEPDVGAVRTLIAAVLAEGRDGLTEPEAKSVLEHYGIPTVPTRVAASGADAARVAGEFGAPVALKILSRDISHKSDVGGVVLDLESPEAVAEAADAMLRRVAGLRPDAVVDGFTVQPMARRPGCFELIVGANEDRQFGPVILFGEGGTAVEVIGDTAIGLPPLNLSLATEMIRRTRIHDQLVGYRDRPPTDLDGIAQTMVRISRLLIDHPQIVELDINPLLADAAGVIALDARMTVRPAAGAGHERLAIRPYPSELEKDVPLGDGRTLLLRPIVPEDEPSIQRTFATLTAEEIRLRFFVPLKTLSHVVAARFTQIDYDREMALVLTDHDVPGRASIWGVVHIIADPDRERAEFSILIHHDMTGLGLGMYLMRRIIDYAREQHIGRLEGDVLVENRAMRRLCAVLGFGEQRVKEEPGIVRVVLDIAGQGTAAPESAA